MKVGIITFHYAYNYGAVLQAYATQDLLVSMGHKVEIIDYRNNTIEKSYRTWCIQEDGAKALPRAFSRWRRSRSFKRFIEEHLVLSPRTYHSNDAIEDDYDVILFGSDQIWNDHVTGGMDDSYWGNIPSKAIKVAWAASSGESLLPDSESVRSRLTGFDAISVREESLRDQIESMLSVRVECVPDPTLMLFPDRWRALKSQIKESGYVLAYPMTDEARVISVAKELAKEKGLRLVILSQRVYWRPYKHMIQWAGPEEFLAYMDSASYVVTSSFHGTVFSLLFHKQFLSLGMTDSNNMRIGSLLRKVGRPDRLLTGKDWRLIDNKIDWDSVGDSIAKMHASSISFLNHSIYGKDGEI
ncbi:MAG: polysaccharide pyruvyl transferase family protein [Bacteroidales bacterium]|nr:polysaccharide pyruvyl transferase family protein [Bacteroidales bacterium]